MVCGVMNGLVCNFMYDNYSYYVWILIYINSLLSFVKISIIVIIIFLLGCLMFLKINSLYLFII